MFKDSFLCTRLNQWIWRWRLNIQLLYVQVGPVYWRNFSLFKKFFFSTVPLYKHLEEQCVEFLQFSFRWMNNLLMREIPLRCTIRLWDTYQVRHLGFFQVCHCKRTWHYEIFTFANVVPNMNQENSKKVQFCVNFFVTSQGLPPSLLVCRLHYCKH